MHLAKRTQLSFRSVGAIGLVLAAVISLTNAFGLQLSLAQSDDSIAGEFAVTIVRTDVPTDLADGYNYVGKWIIDINDDGTYSGSRQDVGLLVSGTWQAEGSSVTFTDGSGLVSCTNPTAVTIPGEDVTSGTYEWTRTGDDLQLIPVEEGCGGRLLLLSTRTLGPYIPCTVDPIDTSNIAPEADEVIPVASPEASVDEVLTPDDPSTGTRGGDSASADPATAEPAGDVAAITQEVDDLLAQMTSCWSTGDPDLWLALLSTDFREILIGSEPDFLTTIQSAMAVPIIWERAGGVELQSATNATAIVRTTVDQEQDFQEFLFVLEDGEWRWDG